MLKSTRWKFLYVSYISTTYKVASIISSISSVFPCYLCILQRVFVFCSLHLLVGCKSNYISFSMLYSCKFIHRCDHASPSRFLVDIAVFVLVSWVAWWKFCNCQSRWKKEICPKCEFCDIDMQVLQFIRPDGRRRSVQRTHLKSNICRAIRPRYRNNSMFFVFIGFPDC